jgi:long-chain fatty acid transport protein
MSFPPLCPASFDRVDSNTRARGLRAFVARGPWECAANPWARRTRRVAVTALWAVGAACAAESSAHATGFLTAEFGSDRGQPAIATPYSVYFNPGALAGIRESEVVLDVAVAGRSMDYDRAASALSPSNPSDPSLAGNATYKAANTGAATLFNVLAGPYIGFATDFGHSNLRLGVASYIPFGGQIQWDKNSAFAGSASAPGAYDGPQRWASIGATTASLYQTLALAYRIEGPRLGLGVSASVIRTSVTDVRARNLDGSDDIFGPGGVMKEGRSEIDASGFQFGAAAGIYWEATSDGALRLGLSYTSQPGFGSMRLNGWFRIQPGTQETPNPLTSADFVQAYPDIVRAGAAWRVSPAAELRLDGSLQRWSQFKNQCVVVPGAACDVDANGASASGNVLLNLPRSWRDAWKVRLGGAFWTQPESEIFGSVAYETSPVGAGHIDALTFDSTRLYGTIGARHKFGRSFAVQASYTYVYFVPVTVTGSALPNYAPPSTWPSADGRYTSELFLFDAAVSYSF